MSRATARVAGADLVPLGDRLRWMQLLRLGMAALILAGRYLLPTLGGLPLDRLAALTAAYLVLCGAGEYLWRAVVQHGGRSGLLLFGALLLVDGAYLAGVAYHSGGVRSPVSALVLLHLVAVMLLASYRTGLKLALWHSLLVFAVFRLRFGGVLFRAPSDSVHEQEQYLAAYVVALWAVALTTAVFSAVNERELRRRRYDSQVVAGMLARLNGETTQSGAPATTGADGERDATAAGRAGDAEAVARVLLDEVLAGFDFVGGAVLARPAGGHRSSLDLIARSAAAQAPLSAPVHDLADADEAVAAALADRRPVLVARPDGTRHPLLRALLPDAANVAVVPLQSQGTAVGVLVLQNAPSRGRRLERRVLTVVEQMAAHASLSLRNAWLMQALHLQASSDGLTGVANRRTFDAQLARELQRLSRTGDPLSLLLVDVDHFKKLNDAHGHLVGDTVLKLVAQCMADRVRAIDLVARYGGEEFGVLLPGTDRYGAFELAETLREAIAVLDPDRPVTVSIGCVTTELATPGPTLVQAADRALYEAKNSGRNRTMLGAVGDDPVRLITERLATAQPDEVG